MVVSNWEADKMLDVYIYDYFIKRNLHASAEAFLNEGKISLTSVAIDAPGGFLFEWWSIFWELFIARTNENHSMVSASNLHTQQLKIRDLQHQQHPQQNRQQQQEQAKIQQMQYIQMLQRQAALNAPQQYHQYQHHHHQAQIKQIQQIQMLQGQAAQVQQQYQPSQLFSRQQQQQLILQAQTQPSRSPLLQDMDHQRFRVLRGGRGGLSGEDGHPVSDVTGGGASSPGIQAASPLRCASQDQKVFENFAQSQAQRQQQSPSSLQQQQPQQQPATLQQPQQDRLGATGGVSVEGNFFITTDQNYGKGPNPQKRKEHPASSSGPANITGTSHTTLPSPNSGPSTSSTHTSGLMMHGSDKNVLLPSLPNQLTTIDSSRDGVLLPPLFSQLTNIDGLGDGGSLDDNVETHLSHQEADPWESLF